VIVPSSSPHVERHPTRARRRHTASRAVGSLAVAVLVAASSVLLGAPAVSANTPLQAKEWYLGPLGMQQVWAQTRGNGVTVAVLDNGVDASVDDLRGALVPGFDASGKGGNPDVASDDEGHGTQMAVRIAGRGTRIIGIAPQAKILPVLVPNGFSDGSDLASALTKLSAQPSPPQVVNMSLGAPGACPPALQTAVKTAVDKGLILVASAGNEGNSSNASQYPANCKGVIAVGAYDSTGAPWSQSQRQPYVALGAPGVDLPAYNKQGVEGTADGTSDAAAIVSGSFAILRAKFPTMPSRQLVARVLATASRTYYKGPGFGRAGDVLGFGFALVHQALIRPVPATAANPIYDALKTIDTAPPPSGSDPSSAPTSGPSRAPTTVHVDFPGSQASAKSGSSSTGLIVGLIVAVLVVAIIVAVVMSRRGRRSHGAGTTQF
jgi:subtilisin family serine protease